MRKYALLSLATAATVLTLGSVKAHATVIAAPTIEVQTISHGLVPYDPDYGIPPYLIDSVSAYTGGGAFSVPSINPGDTVTIRVQAPAGMKFVIHDPNAGMVLETKWYTAEPDSVSVTGATITFENLVGTAPINLGADPGVGDTGDAIETSLWFQPVGLIEFTAVDISIPVLTSSSGDPRDFGPVSTSIFMSLSNPDDDHALMTLEAVPEPTSLGLLAVGGLALLARRRKA